jgi:hypothetical protein
MNLEKFDHIAIEVIDLDYYLARLVGTGSMRLLRRATAKRTGTRMAMVGDPTGMGLIENKDAAIGVPRSLDVAFGRFQPLSKSDARSVIVSDNQSFTALLVLITINMLAFEIVTLIQVVFGPWSLPQDRN